MRKITLVNNSNSFTFTCHGHISISHPYISHTSFSRQTCLHVYWDMREVHTSSFKHQCMRGKSQQMFLFFFSSLRIIYTSGPQPSSRDTGTRDITRHSFTACGGHYQTERLDGFGLGFGITSALLYQTQSLDNKVKWDAFKPVWRLLFESPRVSVSSQGNQPIKMSVTADRDEDQNQILNIQLVLVLRAEITVTSGCRWFILGQCLSCITQHI